MVAVALMTVLPGTTRAHDPIAFVNMAPGVPRGARITVDGDLGDWSWFPEVLAISTVQSFVHGPDIFDPNDFDWTVRVAWSDEENRIYVAFEVHDDVFFPYDQVGEREVYLYDNFGLIADADHSGGIYEGPGVPEEENGTQAQLWMFPLGGPTEGYHFVYLFGGATWYDEPPYSAYAYRREGERRHVGEIGLIPFDHASQRRPEDSQVHDLTADEVIGLSCLYDDHDEEGTIHDGQWKTHESLEGTIDATVVSHLILLAADPGAAAVEPQTWAWRKMARLCAVRALDNAGETACGWRP